MTQAAQGIDLVIEPRERDLGEFTVRRVLPAARRNMVGPFIFFDHMGPAEFPPGLGISVRPHPHIGIATITYLFEGEIMHRDSLGYEQMIRPGAINLMTAGRGIVHSERAGRHQVYRARSNHLFIPEAVAVHDLALEQVGYGRQANVWMRPHLDALARRKLGRPHVIEKDERAHHATLSRR